jgi:hypothetical protein
MEKRGGQAGPALGELTLQTAACSEPPAKRQNMTFGLPINMRANCVRPLAAWCLGAAAITANLTHARSETRFQIPPERPMVGQQLRCVRWLVGLNPNRLGRYFLT